MFVISFLVILAVFCWLAYASDIIRKPGPQPKGINQKGKPSRKPYSLARTQMAFWFFVIIICYVFIWMVTHGLSSLTTSVLGLMGISAATGLGAAAVDSGKRSNQESQLRNLEEKRDNDKVEIARLKSEISTLNATATTTPLLENLKEREAILITKQGEWAKKEEEIKQVELKIKELSDAVKPVASTRFIDDILSDDGGISFHRFQIFVWTIVLIVIFIASVINTLAMPEFDTMLLALMGISSGTYIGFKLPEQQG